MSLRLPGYEHGSDPLPAVTALLPPAEAELVVMTDTHLVDTTAAHAREFASRLRQNDRIAAALRVAAATGSGELVHLGDLVQDYPENASHAALLIEAVAQVRSVAAHAAFAPGNTDIGDKPDPASPAAVATADTLSRFGAATQGGWMSFRQGAMQVITLAASILNSGLDAEREQWDWLAGELAGSTARWRLLFLHYPIFWRGVDDPGVGNYDVLADPARGRLIELINRYHVAAVFTGHSHFAFLNRIGHARCYGVPSTSFTRPGFSELFSSCPPPDRGRDDVPKLGFHLLRAHEDSTLRVHQVRTGLLADRLDHDHTARPVLTCVPRDVPDSRLGVVVRHPIAQFAQVPDTFPSVRRQPVRNDYPLLACLELGARQVSVGAEDLADPALRERLSVLRDEGTQIAVRLLWPAGIPPTLPARTDPVDEIELILLDRAALQSGEVAWLAEAHGVVPLRLATLMRTTRGRAELPRWRYGFNADEARALDQTLADAPGAVDRLLLSAARADDAAELAASSHDWQGIEGVDLTFALASAADLSEVVEAFLVTCQGGDARFFVDGLTELDRTLDLTPGLLDRSANPQPAFYALAILNSLVHGATPVSMTRHGDVFDLRRPGLLATVGLGRGGDSPSSTTAEVIHLALGLTGRARSVDGPWLELTTVPKDDTADEH